MRNLLASLVILTVPAHAAETVPVRTGSAAFGDWRTDAPGVVRLIRPGDLPAPFATPSASNGPQDAALPRNPEVHVPDGLTASLWAEGFTGPRTIRVAPNGDVFVAETDEGDIKVVRPTAGTEAAAPARVYAKGLDGPFGMAFYPPGDDPRWLYVATTDAVFRYPYRSGDLAEAKPERVLDLDISDGGHSTRDIAFSPDGRRMFVSIGSQSNDAEDLTAAPKAEVAQLPLGAAWGDETRRADVLSFDPEGHDRRIFATGIRNCVGLAVQPRDGGLFCATNERDGLGDNLPSDYVTRVREGGFYGWPWFFIGSHEDPRHRGERPDLAGKVTVPDVLFQAHSAPLTMSFYDPPAGAPAALGSAYAGQAFVAMHGSWNRAKRTGYKVVRAVMADGVPTGAYEDFATGFVGADGRVWGRPVGVAAMRDSSLLIGEDENGTIWRVTPKTGTR
ncbi:PQQ-dependent sugar dehydrogenase [Lichenibacterium dinghuense]|uniref:PQQ-dependent sugar dehydrogenase n=1 Tax=Lichenibacterium dinghuense TaxID=2895977 RepID=UPI001F468780|nr:PQQ-dependent sugar dehydrogenase [Lichenibacterium sp. 6Y81]